MARLRTLSCLLVLLCCGWAQHALAQATLSSQLRLGIGLAQRVLEAPSDTGQRRLDFGPAPAVMLGIDAAAHSGGQQLGIALTYRSSVAGRVYDVVAGPNADASLTPVRSHELEAGVRAGMRLGASVLGLFGGYGVRAFASVAELRVPRFSLHGPLLRIELELPLSAAGMRIRVAPELQWLPAISAALRELSGVSGSALSVGGTAQLSLPLSASFELCLDYRESHAWAPARAARSLSDTQRYLLLAGGFSWL